VFRIETDHRNRPLRSGEFPATAGDSPLFSCSLVCHPERSDRLASRAQRREHPRRGPRDLGFALVRHPEAGIMAEGSRF
jgi:hypothetical protein